MKCSFISTDHGEAISRSTNIEKLGIFSDNIALRCEK